MTLFLTNEEVEKLITVEDAIEVLEPTFADLGAGREQGVGFEIPDELFLQDVHP